MDSDLSFRPLRFVAVLFACLLFASSARAEDPSTPIGAGTVLFDFEAEADVAAWSNIDVYALREAEAKASYDAAAKAAADPSKVKPYRPLVQPAKEPEVKIERTTEGATSGKHALKLTFAGGRMPTISTRSPLDDWRPYKTFSADVTADRTCMVVFRVMTGTGKYGTGWNEGCSRWEFAARVEPGKNTVVTDAPHRLWNAIFNKDVRTFEIYIYQPHEGETITIDNIRLSTEKPRTVSPFKDPCSEGLLKPFVPAGRYKVLGTDLEVRDVDDLADRLKDKWVKPENKTVEQVEGDIRADYEKIRKGRPKAVLVMLRDGQKGYDRADPDKAFAGWEDACTPSHVPMALTLGCFANNGRGGSVELSSRYRPAFLRVDLSSIPRDARILSARLILVRASEPGKDWDAKPTLFAAEPCNRPWKEVEVNVFEYAHDRFWNQYAAMDWGDDGDRTAVFLAYGPPGGKASSWDFTEAVRYWTDGKHPNNGFIPYCPGLQILSRECAQVENRPCLAVIYEPKP